MSWLERVNGAEPRVILKTMRPSDAIQYSKKRDHRNKQAVILQLTTRNLVYPPHPQFYGTAPSVITPPVVNFPCAEQESEARSPVSWATFVIFIGPPNVKRTRLFLNIAVTK